MKLTRKHIGQVFDITSSDGSWAYQLVDIKGHNLLFYDFGCKYWIIPNKYNDWRDFKPQKQSKADIKMAWNIGTRVK